MEIKVFDSDSEVNECLFNCILKSIENPTPFKVSLVSSAHKDPNFFCKEYPNQPGIELAIFLANEKKEIVILYDGFCLTEDEREIMKKYTKERAGNNFDFISIPIERNHLIKVLNDIFKRLS